MSSASTPSRRRMRSALKQRLSSIIPKQLLSPFVSKSAAKPSPFESLTPSDTPGTPSKFVFARAKRSSSSPLSSSPLTASPASVASRAPDRAPPTPPSAHACAHQHARGAAQPRRFSARFSTRTLSRLEAVRSNMAEKKRARSMMGCGCEAAQERDLLSTRLGELAMTEMENESLRAQVDDLQRAVESVRKQAQEEVDSLVLEMHVLKKRATLEHGEYAAYSDDEQYADSAQHEQHMATLWLGERALDASDVAARLEWHQE